MRDVYSTVLLCTKKSHLSSKKAWNSVFSHFTLKFQLSISHYRIDRNLEFCKIFCFCSSNFSWAKGKNRSISYHLSLRGILGTEMVRLGNGTPNELFQSKAHIIRLTTRDSATLLLKLFGTSRRLWRSGPSFGWLLIKWFSFEIIWGKKLARTGVPIPFVWRTRNTPTICFWPVVFQVKFWKVGGIFVITHSTTAPIYISALINLDIRIIF